LARIEYDPTDALEVKGQVLEFYQTFSGAEVSFKAFLTNYNESFASNWASQSVFGRPDPLQTYQGTSRSLNLDWKVPAFSQEDAELNLIKTSTLTRMLYPEYSALDNALTISKGPLIKIKFANLIYDASRGPGGDVRTSGLLGVITSFSWSPDIDQGFFDPGNQLFPKLLTLGIQFNVLHQHSLGWEKAAASQISDKRATRLEGKTDKKERNKVDKINAGREERAADAAPEWGPDASLFPWSAGIQRAGSGPTSSKSQSLDDRITAKQAENLLKGDK